MRIRERRVVFFDTETTGNDTAHDRPIELAVVAWQHGQPDPAGPQSWFINPGMLISPAASAVHHLRDQDVANAPTLDQVLPAAEAYIGDACISAHNAPFDLAMLPSWARYECLDTLRLMRHVWSVGDLNQRGQPLGSHTMQELRYWLDVEVDTLGLAAHRAAADILVTGVVYEATVAQYLACGGEDDFDSFLEFVRSPIMTLTLPFGDKKGMPLVNLEIKELDSLMAWARKKGDPDFLTSLEHAKRRKQVPAAYRKPGF